MQFTQVTYTLSNLIDSIEMGSIGLPEIQRPFVWKTTKVRDLFDSMYRGFPVGFLLFWQNVLEPQAKQIGTAGKQLTPSMLVVDGQQRLTSLYTVMKGQPIITSDFVETSLHIAFRPLDERFEVATPAIRNDAEWIPDIGVVWTQGLVPFVGSFLERLRSTREVDPGEERSIGEAIQRLHDIRNFQFTALQLTSTLDEEQVAEIFVRINSEGVTLKQADFILTLMSVWWDKGRKQLEAFCQDSRTPSISGASPFNWFIQPNPDQLVRVAVALAFYRARLQHVYSILRGKDLQTKEFSQERREQQFEILRQAQEHVLDLTNWHEFFKAVNASGYRGSKMVMSDTNLMYSYAMYLIGRRDFDVDNKSLRDVIARWFFMTSITSRYTGSSETQMEADLARVMKAATATEFVAELDRICAAELTDDFWDIRLPNDLERSGTHNPALHAYDAALCLLGANALFSDLRVTELIDPAITGKKSAIERHHLFPRAYLAILGITKTSEVNQVANYALVEWSDNIAIGADRPSDYYPEYVTHFTGDQLDRMTFEHALPEGWQQMDYRDFLEARRQGIANVTRRAWERLQTTAEGPGDRDKGAGTGVARAPEHWTVEELISRQESDRVEFKSSARWNYKRGEKGREIEDAVVKTVAAFMNTRGGTLIVGVDDDGNVLGLDKDLSTVKGKSLDGFDLWINGLLSNAIGLAATANCVSVSFVKINGADLCRVDVKPSKSAVYATTGSGRNIFFVRTGAATNALDTPEALNYIQDHWSKQDSTAPLAPAPSVQAPPPIPIDVAPQPGTSAASQRFDWSDLHEVLAALPVGRWTTYGTVASVIGTGAQPLGNHLRSCPDCPNAHRVLNRKGKVSSHFRWTDPTDTRDPRQMLIEEGVEFDDSGVADAGQQLSLQELWALTHPAALEGDADNAEAQPWEFIEWFMDNRGQTNSNLVYVKEFISAVVGFEDVEPITGRSKVTEDGLTDYLSVRRRKSKYGSFLYVTPHTGKTDFRLPREEAEGRVHAHPVEVKNRYQVRIRLNSEEAVNEALELAELAYEGVGE